VSTVSTIIGLDGAHTNAASPPSDTAIGHSTCGTYPGKPVWQTRAGNDETNSSWVPVLYLTRQA
jgi:hypothetical protein